MGLQKVIDSLNQQWDCGDFSIMDHTIALDTGLQDIQPDDIVVYYDYCSDELSDDDSDKLVEWLYDDPNGGWNLIRSYLLTQGYVEVADSDGSGNGLFYGANLFKKV